MGHAPEEEKQSGGYRPSAGAALILALIVVAVAGFLISRGGGSARPDCDALVPQIIQLSESNNAGTTRPVGASSSPTRSVSARRWWRAASSSPATGGSPLLKGC